MHDAVTVERLGKPTVGVMTTRFVDAAELMARALGADAYPFAVIEHPVSSATEAALAEEARKTVGAARGIVLG